MPVPFIMPLWKCYWAENFNNLNLRISTKPPFIPEHIRIKVYITPHITSCKQELQKNFHTKLKPIDFLSTFPD